MTRGRRLLAARYLRALASVETAVALNRYEDARRLLDGIDQADARELAAELEEDDRDDGAQVIPFGNPSVLDAWRETYPNVFHAEDNWSRKVGA